MTHPFPRRPLKALALAALAAALALTVQSRPARAETILIDRCSTNQNGIYKPILTARLGAREFVFLIGERGLTNGIAFNRSRTIAWIKKELGLPKTRATYSICGEANYLRETQGTNH